MCFSPEADLVAGLVLVPVAVLSLREVRRPRELPFAALPALFAVHQLIEAVVWAGVEGRVSPEVERAATLAYVLIALSVLPFLVPLAVLMLEPRGARLRVAPFVVLGAVVALVLGAATLEGSVHVVEHPHALGYAVGLDHAGAWTVAYIVAVIGPSLLSGYRSIVIFGVLNLVGLTVVAVAYVEAFASLWCVYAALTSTLVLVHMVRRRRLTDALRLDGEPRLVPTSL